MRKILLETVSGRNIDIENISVDDIDVSDMAWALSNINRFNGHGLKQYSVAEHSLFVAAKLRSELDKEGMRKSKLYYQMFLQGLLHDAHEYLIGDIITSVKYLPDVLPVIKDLEDKIDSVIYKSLNLPMPTPPIKDKIKEVDNYVISVEAFHLMPSRGKDWRPDSSVDIYELPDLQMLTQREAYSQFKTVLKNAIDDYQAWTMAYTPHPGTTIAMS